MEVDDNGTKSVLHKKYFFCASTKRRAEKENEKCGKSFSPKKKKTEKVYEEERGKLVGEREKSVTPLWRKGRKEKRENFLIDWIRAESLYRFV